MRFFFYVLRFALCVFFCVFSPLQSIGRVAPPGSPRQSKLIFKHETTFLFTFSPRFYLVGINLSTRATRFSYRGESSNNSTLNMFGFQWWCCYTLFLCCTRRQKNKKCIKVHPAFLVFCQILSTKTSKVQELLEWCGNSQFASRV